VTSTQSPTSARGGRSELDRAIALTARSENGYEAHLDEAWSIGAGINGGLLLAVCAHALRQSFAGNGHPDPLTVSAYYLSAATRGPAVLGTEVLRRGRSMSTGSVSEVWDSTGRLVAQSRQLARAPQG
jgi:acyl-coenzyme A thioesterase PaaI-like protein